MNEVTSRRASSMVSQGASPKSRPLSFLAQLANSAANGCLQVSNGSITWAVMLENGKITYASHSVDPFDRIDNHLRRLSHQISTLDNETRSRLRPMFERSKDGALGSQDYRAICWLVSERYLNPVEAASLIEHLVNEVMESFVLLKESNSEFLDQLEELPTFCRFDLPAVVNACRRRLQSWQALSPQICSPYQRPYLASQTQAQQKLTPDMQRKLGAVLKGFSFRHLATLLNQDEIKLAQSLRPYITDGTIVLREPKPPFDRLPKIPIPASKPVQRQLESTVVPLTGNTVIQPTTVLQASNEGTNTETHTIACIDDSPTILNEMKRFLDDENFTVVAINDPLKALIQVIRLKPDLILLDIGMPNIDGYKLCRLLRNHSLFGTTPIVMVTGNTGIIDRAKAKFAGASDYMTKPFSKPELLKVVFKHLA